MIVLDAMEYATDALALAAWPSLENLISFANNSYYTDSGANNFNVRIVIAAASISVSGSHVQVRFKGHDVSAQTLSGAAIGERSGSTGNFSTAPTRLTFSGANGGTIPAGSYLTSDLIAFNIDETKDYLVHFYLDTGAGDVNTCYGASAGRYFKRSYGVDNTLTQDISGLSYANDSTVATLDKIDITAINVLSESTIKEQGSYSLKVVAAQTSSLNKAITHTLSPTFNLSGQNDIKIWVRASRTGTNFKLGIHDSGGTTTESNIAISSADTWELKTIDISAVSDANKDAINSIILTITNADAANTIYIDYLVADNVTWPDAKYVYHGVDRGDGTTGTLHASTISAAAGAGSNLSASILLSGNTVDDITGTLTLPDRKYLYNGIDRGDGQTGTLRASNIKTNTGCAGVDLSAAILKKASVVDDVTGTYEGVTAGSKVFEAETGEPFLMLTSKMITRIDGEIT